jgi:hypothetical protein
MTAFPVISIKITKENNTYQINIHLPMINLRMLPLYSFTDIERIELNLVSLNLIWL